MDREKAVKKRLRKVIDPHTGISILDMGLITSVHIFESPRGFHVTIAFRPDMPECPILDDLKTKMIRSVKRLRWVRSVDIKVVDRVRRGV